MVYDDLKIAIKRRNCLRNMEISFNTEYIYQNFCINSLSEALLPETAIRMDEVTMQKRYSNISECAEIYFMPDDSAHFVFQRKPDIPFSHDDIEKMIKSTKDTIMRVQPGNTFYEAGVIETNKKIGWFDFGGYGIEGKIYNIIFFYTVQEMLRSGSFQCKAEQAVLWKPIFLNILQSLKDREASHES